MKSKAINHIDFYKAGHLFQYPDGTDLVYANLTPRGLRYLPKIGGIDNTRVRVIGLQYFCMEFLIADFNRSFFGVPLDQVVEQYKRRMDTSLGVDSVSVDHIIALHNLGYLPIEIMSLPEGVAVPEKVPVLTIHNTLPQFFWLTNYLETVLSAWLWKFMTSATIADRYRQILTKYAKETGGDLGFIQFQAHDFSFRGMSCSQDAAMSGAAHLTQFVGTDTVVAIDLLEDYYGADASKELVGCSVPATEHSVMCAGGKVDELETFRRLINKIYPKGIVSIVSDTWDFWKVLTEYLPILKDEIMARDGKVVIRPDSGDPVDIICGDYTAAPGTPAFKGAIKLLWEVFGGTVNSKGYKVLDPHIGLIYGDSITLERADEIMRRLSLNGFASTNVVFGVGSYTYQYQTRDTLGWAVKATAAKVNGQYQELFKDPITDSGLKKSATGFLKVVKDGDSYKLIDRVKFEEIHDGELKTVFIDGRLVVKHTLAEIRARSVV
jgi:nicotinamide phosphoribosyltransferase